MIAAQKSGQVEGNLTADQKVPMGIDTENFGKIMSILTDLYSNRVYAFIREYSTNAWDAQVEAGVQRPIEITLPTRFNPRFIVRDFGVGLSVEDIHVIYSQYGSSTKRQTNDQVGMLGLGCKSALTYTSQFTVTSVQNGTKVQVIVAREADGAGSMHIADTSATTDSDGTTITIPVMAGDIQRVSDESHRFYSYWKPGSVLVDGKTPASIIDGAMKITDDIYAVPNDRPYGDGVHRVVMGNVPYQTKLDISIPRGHDVVAFVPIGSVEPHPSRERLIEGPGTDPALAKVADDYAKGIVGVVEREVRSARTHAEALQARFKWASFIAAGSVITYKGEAIPDALIHPQCAAQQTSYPTFAPGHVAKPGDRPYEVKNSYYKTKSDGRWKIPATEWAQHLWVHGWDYAKLSRTQAAKIDKYVADNRANLGLSGYGNTPRVVLHPLPFPHAKWLDARTVIDWKVIEAVALPKNASGTGYAGQRLAGSFDCYVDGYWKPEVDANDIDQKRPVYYYAGPSAHSYTSGVNSVLRALGRKYTIVTMPSNRKDKFLRDFPKAKSIAGVIQGEYDAWVEALTADQRIALAMYDADVENDLTAIQAANVNDPDLKEAIRIANLPLTKTLEARKLFERNLPWGAVKTSDSYTSPLAKYPLYTRSGMRSDPTHTYWYLNAAFAANI